MILAALTGRSLLVTSLKASVRSILLFMGLDHVLIDFLTRAAVGAASVFLVIMFAGLRIPRRAAVAVRRPNR